MRYYKGIGELAVDRVEQIGEHLIKLYNIGKEILPAEMQQYKYWENLCTKNNYSHSGHESVFMHSIMKQFEKNANIQKIPSLQEKGKLLHLPNETPYKKEVKYA